MEALLLRCLPVTLAYTDYASSSSILLPPSYDKKNSPDTAKRSQGRGQGGRLTLVEIHCSRHWAGFSPAQTLSWRLISFGKIYSNLLHKYIHTLPKSLLKLKLLGSSSYKESKM